MALKLNRLQLDQLSADPASPADGDLWYNSTANTFRGRVNGVSEDIPAAGGGGSLFGTEFANQYAASSSGSNTTPVPVLSLILSPGPPAGTYRIGWSCTLMTDNREVFVQVIHNLSTNLGIGMTKDDIYGQMQSGFAIVTCDGGAQFFDMEFWVDQDGDSWDATEMRLEFWRIS